MPLFCVRREHEAAWEIFYRDGKLHCKKYVKF